MKDYSVLDKLVSETKKLHRAIFDEGYTLGYMDGKAEVYKSEDAISRFDVLDPFGHGRPSVIPKSGKGEYIPASALKDEIDKIDNIEVFNGKVYVRVGDVFKILDRHISGKENG